MPMKKYVLFFGCLIFSLNIYMFSQPVPAEDENLPYLVTFGPDADTKWGDDDFTQTFFFLIPEEFSQPFFIRVYDPEIGGSVDELNDSWNTTMQYSIYGGEGAYTHEDAQNPDPVGHYKSGNQLAQQMFSHDTSSYNKQWYTFGPFNPTEGEWVKKFSGRIFKIIVEGIEGNDGNLYRFFISTLQHRNKRIEGANAFTYEYTFRMHDDPSEVSHIYPYVDKKTVSVKQSNFDWDNDGYIRVVSVARKGKILEASGQDKWVESKIQIKEEEKQSSLDFQFIKRKSDPVQNNNVVINVRNQYGELMPFYTVPIGGVPEYEYEIGVESF